MTYELRVDFANGFEIVKLDAASIAEATQRAKRIWNPETVEGVTVLCTIDPKLQEFLAW